MPRNKISHADLLVPKHSDSFASFNTKNLPHHHNPLPTPTTMPADAPEQQNPSAPSKSALKKAAKEAEKAKKKAETAARLAVQKLSLQEAESVDHSEGQYGTLPLIQSTSRTGILSPSLSVVDVDCRGEENSD